MAGGPFLSSTPEKNISLHPLPPPPLILYFSHAHTCGSPSRRTNRPANAESMCIWRRGGHLKNLAGGAPCGREMQRPIGQREEKEHDGSNKSLSLYIYYISVQLPADKRTWHLWAFFSRPPSCVLFLFFSAFTTRLTSDCVCTHTL